MKIAALVLYALASAFQMAGAYLVIRDVLTSRANMRAFNDGLDNADRLAEAHAARAAHAPTPAIAEVTRLAVWQVGPAQARQRETLVAWVRAQNDISDRRRWIAVGLLLSGLVVGFVGNVLSLLPL
ncbi:hypothetical protein [Mycobacterium sp. 1245852.3]|uniref:hypothetical protein n=1 Tax=Mycobacterium sp. 1245852.3 TaxID=1856860 RepID=UPI0007FBAD8C|nr:hypothetical protein [Mycobacterium sp. 1245852.3]OBK02669.1 hypothetical protein A9W96_16390 [Mycobacterium sp. 1245852.3]